jgi:glycosyltransferase involved in cell wall biosynthesis
VRYALELRALAPTVWDSVDCISHLFAQARAQSDSARARLMASLELGRTRSYEGWLMRQFDRILVTSAVDKGALEQLAMGAASPIAVLPNGVDLEAFRPPVDARRPDSLVLSGKMGYHANSTAVLYFMSEIMPLIWHKRPQTKLWIVGQSPPAVVKKLASDPRVTVTGQVVAMQPYLAGATVAICPVVYGAGIQNKVLEAMACATPVVSTPASLSALGVQTEREALAGGSAQEFARQVLRLLSDPELAERVGEAGRRFVERRHSWGAVALQLIENYNEVIDLWQSRKPLQPGGGRQRSSS